MKWFFSETLQLYISLEPLKISNQVFRIAKQHHISLEWDDYGNIIMLNFDEYKLLVHKLGGVILSPTEYWQVYNEAEKKGEERVKQSLMSPQFTEILDRVYVDDNTYIDHCEILGNYEYGGNKIHYEPVVGRPGWITPEDIDGATGHPMCVHENNPEKSQIKYWSPDLKNTEVKKTFALRGFVTSVNMPSLDLGIPADSRQPKMMVRLCRTELPKELVEEKEQKGSFLSLGDFQQYVKNHNEMLLDALENDKMVTFVTGHKNPDADTVISALFEAFRRNLGNKDPERVYLPLVQSKSMPKEIRYILGDEITNALIYSECQPLDMWVQTGKIRFVFTDQNYQKEYQKYVIAIIDHHKMNKELEGGSLEIPCQIEMLGSCTALIIKHFLSQGYDFDEQLSKILYAAMLMDTENRAEHKMTQMDKQIMDLFQEKAKVDLTDAFYTSIMKQLLSETDGAILYNRDYKHYYGFGFGVLKVSGRIDSPGWDEWLEKICLLAQEDNLKNNDYVTLVKIVDYESNGLQVSRERIYWVWNHTENLFLMEKLKEMLCKLIAFCIPQAHIVLCEQYVEIVSGGRQISRKKIVPALEALMEYCGQYSYVTALKKWVSKDFLKVNDAVKAFYPDIKADAKGRVCQISFLQAKKLMEHMGMEMLSLKEYWQVYEEAMEIRDTALFASLSDADFLEFLDTWYQGGRLVHKPLSEKAESYDTEILYANPGLVSPKHIDEETGLPNHIFSAANYHDKSLWRYWCPMQDKTYVFSRSYIFLLQQPCLDAKSAPTECFVNMGIRPMRESNLSVDVVMEVIENTFVVRYKSEYEKDYKEIYRTNMDERNVKPAT